MRALLLAIAFILLPLPIERSLAAISAIPPEVAEAIAAAEGEAVPIFVQVRRGDALVAQIGQRNAMLESGDATASELASLGINVLRIIHETDLLVVEVTSEQVAVLAAVESVGALFPDRVFTEQLRSAIPRAHADIAHAAGADGLGTTIVVIDSGVEAQHPFFEGRVKWEACFSGGSGLTSFCPGGLKEIRGGAGAAAPCGPACAHGTHVAGIAAGHRDGLTGFAPRANLAAITALSHGSDPSECGKGIYSCNLFIEDDLVSALTYVRDDLLPVTAVTAVNLSLGGGTKGGPCRPSAYDGLIAELRQRGVSIVAGTGNEGWTGTIFHPACLPGVVSVGAINNSDPLAVWYWSNAAPGLDLLAPGGAWGIYSSIPGGQYESREGTSMATPMVSGAIAALRGKFYVSPDEVEQALRASGVTVTDAGDPLPAPVLNVGAAMNLLEASRPAGAKVWMKDSWADNGNARDAGTAGKPMWESPFIWVRHQHDGDDNPHASLNPEAGQINTVYVKVLNTGRAKADGQLELFRTPATPTPNLAESWESIAVVDADMPPRQEGTFSIDWAIDADYVGHHCLLAKWTPDGADPTLAFTDLYDEVHRDTQMVWRNVNVVDLVRNEPADASFDLYKAGAGDHANIAIDVRGAPGVSTVLELVLPAGVAGSLAEEPTMRFATLTVEGDSVRVRLPLRNGVTYLPLPDDAMPDRYTVRATLEHVEGRLTPFRYRVVQVEDIAEHKRNGGGVIGGISYVIGDGNAP